MVGDVDDATVGVARSENPTELDAIMSACHRHLLKPKQQPWQFSGRVGKFHMFILKDRIVCVGEAGDFRVAFEGRQSVETHHMT